MFLLFYNQTPTHIVFHNIYIYYHITGKISKKNTVWAEPFNSLVVCYLPITVFPLSERSPNRDFTYNPQPGRCGFAVYSPKCDLHSQPMQNRCHSPKCDLHFQPMQNTTRVLPAPLRNPLIRLILKIPAWFIQMLRRVPFCIRPLICTSELRYNEFLSKTPLFQNNQHFTTSQFQKTHPYASQIANILITHLRSTHFRFFHLMHPFAPKTVSCIMKERQPMKRPNIKQD